MDTQKADFPSAPPYNYATLPPMNSFTPPFPSNQQYNYSPSQPMNSYDSPFPPYASYPVTAQPIPVQPTYFSNSQGTSDSSCCLDCLQCCGTTMELLACCCICMECLTICSK